MIKKIVYLVLLVVFISGCATAPGKIKASYVSPVTYYSWSCQQIEAEMARVSAKVSDLSGAQQSERNKDAVALTAGLVIFWPALFFMMGDDQKQEIARLKGEYEALEKAAIHNECGFITELQKERQKQLEEQEKEKDKKKNQQSDSKGSSISY
jgi:uncharacterized protein YceK